jgi:hypothetical protein
MPPTTPSRDTRQRAVWAAIILNAAVVVAVVTGLLSRVDGATLPSAILTAGGAFAGTAALLLALAHFTGDGGGRS